MDSSSSLPQTFAEAIAHLRVAVLQRFDAEIEKKHLHYHNRSHIACLQQRADRLFDAVAPILFPNDEQRDRHKQLLNLSIAAHDMVQIFSEPVPAFSSRRREAGVSERATIERLRHLVWVQNQQISTHHPGSSALLSPVDVQMLEGAIAATVCHYDPADQGLFQPALYSTTHAPSVVARLLALADLGALGMDGIEVYRWEDSLLFLEENLDVVKLLQIYPSDRLVQDNPTRAENLRQRLLRRARFQVTFAQSRLARLPAELSGLPPAAQAAIATEFRHLTPETVSTIEATTPVEDDLPLLKLIQFFRLTDYIQLAE
ncbi:hypothetical protein ACQ4M4_18435 [Leptolyngbya sp. AN02str]|uniref:hypothetical protein n=1 Tax=Leptolyngbya sp. AN02str TaxID=3423363 RepID=UPI003D31B2D4